MDKGSGVFRQHVAVSQTRVSRHGCLAEVTLLRGGEQEGRSFRTLLCCFGEQRGAWLVWLVFPCLESTLGSVYERKENKSLTDHSIHNQLIYIQSYSVMLTNNYCILVNVFGVTCCHGGLERKKTNVKGRYCVTATC